MNVNREQFMETLEELLSDIPDEERDEVLDFYEDYFDDAGEENESEVVEKEICNECHCQVENPLTELEWLKKEIERFFKRDIINI